MWGDAKRSSSSIMSGEKDQKDQKARPPEPPPVTREQLADSEVHLVHAFNSHLGRGFRSRIPVPDVSPPPARGGRLLPDIRRPSPATPPTETYVAVASTLMAAAAEQKQSAVKPPPQLATLTKPALKASRSGPSSASQSTDTKSFEDLRSSKRVRPKDRRFNAMPAPPPLDPAHVRRVVSIAEVHSERVAETASSNDAGKMLARHNSLS